MLLYTYGLLFLHQLLLLTAPSFGQDENMADIFSGSGSGSGIDEEINTLPVPTQAPTKPTFPIPSIPNYEEIVRKLLLAELCSNRPDVCKYSPEVCPCGSVQETILFAHVFHVNVLSPCRPVKDDGNVYFRECDDFIQNAATRAATAHLEIKELKYLYYRCFALRNDITQPDSIAHAAYDLHNTIERRLLLLGNMGPSDPGGLEIFPYVTGNVYRRLTISYFTSQEIADNKEKYPYFYSTIPPPKFFVQVTLKLLSDNGWRRVAIISSREESLLRNSELLWQLGLKNDTYDFLLTNPYDDDPEPILDRFKRDDYRIFVANVESFKARRLFCEALQLNLTTERHQWILPSFYDHKWWEGPDTCEYDTNCCTNEEILEAAVGVIFVGESTINYSDGEDSDLALRIAEDVYNYTISVSQANETREDRLYLLHSRLLYVYDAFILFAVSFNDAIGELYEAVGNSTGENDQFCEDVLAPLSPFTHNILIEKMNEILNRSVFCGFSGHYVLGSSNILGQAWITQFHYYENCSNETDLGNFVTGVSEGCYKESDIGRYANFERPKECNYYRLQSIDEVELNAFQSDDFQFRNSCCQQTSRWIATTRPYQWKGENPWKRPSDGACYGDSCRCLNQLGPPEIIVGSIITASGVTVCAVLLLLNCLLRKNKHIKASSPRFNTIVVVSCMVMYLVPLFTSLSLSGNYFDEDKEKLIPYSCEISKWCSQLGLTVIISTLVCRNWRIYRIFYNPRIKERRFLSDFWISLFIIMLTLPTLVVIITWTSINAYHYSEESERATCPGLEHLDDSIDTYRVTIGCAANNIPVWEGAILGYDLVLGALLIFLAYQNSTITSHFAEEGEFGSKAMFFVTLFLFPTFILTLIINDTNNSHNIPLFFWSRVGYGTIFPTLLLFGLYLPKFIQIARDKQNSIQQRRTIRLQHSLQQEYETKLHEISDLRSRLKSIHTKQESYTSTTLDSPFGHNGSVPGFYDLRRNDSLGGSMDHRDSFFSGGLDHRNSAITSTIFSFHREGGLNKKLSTPSPLAETPESNHDEFF